MKAATIEGKEITYTHEWKQYEELTNGNFYASSVWQDLTDKGYCMVGGRTLILPTYN